MKSIKFGIISFCAVIAVLFLGFFMVQSVKNRAVALEEQIHEAKSNLTVQYKRREDLIGNLVDTVKEYDKYEYQALVDIVNARKQAGTDAGIEEISKQINVVAEAYPELKANENYKTLMLELATTENMIMNYRNNYNAQVKSYKRYVRKVIVGIILTFTGYDCDEDFSYLNYDSSEDAPTNLFGEK